MKLGREFICKYLAYILPIVFLYFISIKSPGFIWIAFIEVSLLAWNKSKGVWETEPNIIEVKKWAKSPLFNAYVFFLIIHLLYNIYFWIVRPSYTSDELEFNFFWIYSGLVDFFGSVVINSVALFAFIKKGVPRQILLIPILDFIFTKFSSFPPEMLWYVFMRSYFFAIVTLIPLFWVLYIKFIFLNTRPFEDIQ